MRKGGREKNEEGSWGCRSCRAWANQSLLLVAVNSCGPAFGKPDICLGLGWGGGGGAGTEILQLSGKRPN